MRPSRHIAELLASGDGLDMAYADLSAYVYGIRREDLQKCRAFRHEMAKHVNNLRLVGHFARAMGRHMDRTIIEAIRVQVTEAAK